MGTTEILSNLGIETLNAMQQDTMQAYRKSANLVLISPTGSGKTLAYLLPLLESMGKSGGMAMVIVPSRELALQTQQVVHSTKSGIRSVAVYGGRPAMEEHRTMKGVLPQLVVGTSGRLLDHLTKGNIDGSQVKTLIIDEFDKCLEMGFQEEMAKVFNHLKNVEKRMLLSATDKPEITRFLPTYTRLDYAVDGDTSEGRIEEYIVPSPEKDKLHTLRSLLLELGSDMSIVFVNYRESVDRVIKYLHQEGFHAVALHGGMEQKERERALFRFACGSVNVLVSTDLASRGLDIPEVGNVVHYHLSPNRESYIHRNGRTARWDKEGRAFVILGPEEDIRNFAEAERKNDFTVKHLPSASSDVRTQPMRPRWETLYIGRGKREKISKGDIAGFLMKVGGLSKDEVGRIEVRDHYAYASVVRERVREVLMLVKGQKIKGQRTLVEIISK